MAHYEQLPIYKSALDLAVYVEKIVRGFSRYNKYAIGAQMRGLSQRTLILVARANGAEDKHPALAEAGEKLQELLLLARISKELNAFAGFSSFECLVKMTVDVARQSAGWLRSQNSAHARGGRGPEAG